MLLFRAGDHKLFVRIANREDPDQTVLKKQSDLGLHCLSRPFCRQIMFEIIECLLLSFLLS